MKPKETKPKKGKGGRPSKYQPEFPKQAEKMTRLGATDKDLADFFEVNTDTIYEWKNTHPEFSEALKRGKELADGQVIQSLYKRATGYEFQDTQFASFQGMIISKEYTKHIPPDPTSMIFWLKNRLPKEWRDRQEIDHTSKDEKINSIPNTGITADQLEKEFEKRGLPKPNLDTL